MQEPTTQGIRGSECPNCGAPVSFAGLPDDVLEVHCQYCGSVLRRSAPRQAPQVRQQIVIQTPPTVARSSVTYFNPPRARRASGCGLIVPLGMALAGLAITAFALGRAGVLVPLLARVAPQLVSQSAASDGSVAAGVRSGVSTAVAQTVPAPNVLRLLGYVARDRVGGLPDAYIATTENYTDYAIGLLDPMQKKLTWKVPVSKEYYNARVVQSGARAYIIDAETVIAVDAGTGEVAWRASAARAAQTSCDFCAYAGGGNLLTLAKDGTLQAFNLQTGTQVWSKRYETTVQRLYGMGDRVAVAEPQSGKGLGFVVTMLNAATGEAVKRIEAVCKTDRSSAGAGYDTYRFSQDLSTLYAVWDTPTNCAQRYDLGSGQMLWQKTFKSGEGWPFSMNASWNAIFAANSGFYMYVTDSGSGTQPGITLLDAKNGAVQRGAVSKDYTVKLLGTTRAEGGELLVAKAQSRFDQPNERIEVWGIDGATAARTWQSTFSASEKDMDKLEVNVNAAGVQALQCFRGKKGCQFVRLNAANGTTSAPVPVVFEGGSATFVVYTDDALWVGNGRELRVLDLQTGQVKASW